MLFRSAQYIPKSFIDSIPHGLLGSELKENAIGVLKPRLTVTLYMSHTFHRVWEVTYVFFLIIFFTETAFSLIQYAPLLELKRARKLIREAL